MKVRQIEEMTSGSVASVSVSMPKGGTQKRTESMFKGKKTKKKFYEGKMKRIATDMEELSDAEFKKKYSKTKEEMRALLKEEDIAETDLIVVPSAGKRLKSGFIPREKDRTDHEVEMALSDLFQCAKNSKIVYDILKNVSEQEGIEGWVQEKIIKANDYLNTIREYLEHKVHSDKLPIREYDLNRKTYTTRDINPGDKISYYVEDSDWGEKTRRGHVSTGVIEKINKSLDIVTTTDGNQVKVVDITNVIPNHLVVENDDPMINIQGGGGTLPMSALRKKAKNESKEITEMVFDDKFRQALYHLKQLKNTLHTIVEAEKEMSPTGESSIIKGIMTEKKKPCPQCGSTECTCPPGECDCTPVLKEQARGFHFDSEWDGEMYKSLASLVKYNDGIYKSPKQRYVLEKKIKDQARTNKAELKNWFNVDLDDDQTQKAIVVKGMASWAAGIKGQRPVSWVFVLDDLGVVKKYKLKYKGDLRSGTAPDPEKTQLEFQRNDNTITSKIDDFRNQETSDKEEREKKAKEKESKPKGKHIGSTGEKISVSGTLELSSGPKYGEFGEYYINKIRTDDGDLILNFGKSLGNKGDKIKVKGTVKKHSTDSITGEPITVVGRMKLAEKVTETKDACYRKVKSRYKVWPSAYASGALVKCRKVGASNWGNKSKKK